MIFNTIRVNLSKCGSISQAISICESARKSNLSIIISCDSGNIPETSDTFIADFAVAIGASQFMGGGILSGENIAKYNRLMEIGREDESVLFTFLGRKFRK